MDELCSNFNSRDALAAYVKEIAPWCEESAAAPTEGTQHALRERLGELDALNYGQTRNHMDGKVSYLSPYIRHGMVSLNAVRNAALLQASEAEQVSKFIQELAWRDFWQRIYVEYPEWIWNDVEPYKTGFCADDYADDMPEDILRGETGVACIDQFIKTLLETGYMHNHTRMYVAAYVVHWRRVKWQVGAKWFLHHLLDGDPASNNLSWQWVASTFANKPYFFNLENVTKYASSQVNVCPQDNAVLDGSYEALSQRLFPYKDVQNG